MPEEEGATEEVAGEEEAFYFRAIRKSIMLKSSDGMLFQVSKEAARLSVLLADMIDEGCAGSIIPLLNVDGRSLATVIEYCNKHADAAAVKPGADEGSGSSSSGASGEALKEWDRKLIDGLSMDALYDLINAANFLNVKDLLGAACQKVADMIKSKTPEQVRRMFGIANDFTKEEEEEIRKETSWAFDE
ncbi:hypothetical protein PR202_ga29111 [Eleusine coracana subsp. coracana]|uniref:SKP1-like protein n=1 Tax=Eleusine coracana subsp. coracana TaxID=191504 RepID=A0AAV5DL62_ELECO|nr:hypothetical protein PR202_ga29111 [Eleusine coracana subsp. coracana]